MRGESWKEKFPLLVIISGLVTGAIAAFLTSHPDWNPGNMGVCMACFERDIAGALGLHRAASVQYLRPEILGIALGATIIASLFGREAVARSGSAPAVRFVVGAFVMIGALVFLGCPTRLVLRLGGGDYNALLGLAGFAGGIGVGAFFLKKGTSLGRARKEEFNGSAWIMPLLALAGLALVFLRPHSLFESTSGAGSKHAPVLLSLGAGLVIGGFGQRSRMCFAGGIRDMILFRSPHLLVGFVAVLVAVLAVNLVAGDFKLGFIGQPAAHTMHAWNFLGMMLVGLGSMLLGGCPFRQLVLASQGNGDSVVAVMGMLAGAACAHNFGLAASGKGVGPGGMLAVVVGIVLCLLLALAARKRA